MDIDALVAPLSDSEGAKAGPDLSYDDARIEIEAPFQLDGGGETVEERAWRDSIRGITAQAAVTRDLWLATYLARAGAKVGDLQLVADGTLMLARLLEELWDEVHPTLDEADFVGRKTPCDSLTKIREFLGPLKRVTIWEHRLGKFTGEDLARFATQGEGAEGYGQFRAATGSTDPAELKEAFGDAIAKLDLIKDAVTRTDAVLVAKAGSDTGTNFAPTYEALDVIRSAALPYAGLEPDLVSDAEGDVAGAGFENLGAAGPALSGRVNSREDVSRALDAIIDYYRAREPASPVPTLLKRARHWVTMDFLQLIDEMLPASMDEAKKLLVSKLDEPKDESGY